ncbi:MAG: hypothetical protein M3Q48_12780 [Actinomycetota bacterium]|nr:hypothetical protein [Actinomycetota bacterium]
MRGDDLADRVRRGQVTAQPAKRPPTHLRRFERAGPNECWQGDDTHYTLASGQEVRIINIIDDHSRYNAESLAMANCTTVRVWEAFCRGANAWACQPSSSTTTAGPTPIDNEAPAVFQAHLGRLGVGQLRSRAHHPQTCGKVERFHQTQRRGSTPSPWPPP